MVRAGKYGNLWEGVEAAAAGRDRSACHGRSASICATQPVAQLVIRFNYCFGSGPQYNTNGSGSH